MIQSEVALIDLPTLPTPPVRIPASARYLTFGLGREEYGIDILKVQEIRIAEEATRIANAPSFLKGLLNLRGTVVPLIDLRERFGLCAEGEGATIVLQLARGTVGIVVDTVREVVEVHSDDVRPPPEFNELVDAGYVLGLVPSREEAGRMLILVDIDSLIAAPDMGLAAMH